MNGFVNMPDNTEGSTTTYSCNTGFSVNGAKIVTCGSDGNWSPDLPTCERELMLTILNPQLMLVLVAIICFLL